MFSGCQSPPRYTLDLNPRGLGLFEGMDEDTGKILSSDVAYQKAKTTLLVRWNSNSPCRTQYVQWMHLQPVAPRIDCVADSQTTDR